VALRRASGHVFPWDRKRGRQFYAKFRLPDGRQVQKLLGPAWMGPGRPPSGYLTRKCAEAELRRILVDAEDGALAGMAKTGATFADAAREYLRYVEVDREREPTTIRDYAGVIRGYLVPWFGEQPIEAITHRDIAAYRDALKQYGRSLREMPNGEPKRQGKLSNRTVVRHLTVAHSIFKRARQVWDDLPANPASADLVERPEVAYDGSFAVLAPHEVRLLASHAPDAQTKALYLTAAFTGLRQGELFAVRWRDIDFSLARVHVRSNFTSKRLKTPKSGRVRSAPLVDEVMAVLDGLSKRGYLDGPDDLVFAAPAGGHLDDMAVRRAFYTSLETAGLRRIRFHDLRHSFATLAVQHWELPRVQAYMGHAHISTTERYIHFTPAVEDAAVLSAALRATQLDPRNIEVLAR
jgi:integrase